MNKHPRLVLFTCSATTSVRVMRSPDHIGIENRPFIDQAPLPMDLPPDFGDEESVDLRDVSSDVEIGPDELEGLDESDDEAYVRFHVYL